MTGGDGTEAALRALAKEVGTLNGRMEGNNQRMDDLGREIGQLRGLIENKDRCCSTCRNEIDSKLDAQGREIATINERHTGETAVSAFIKSTLGQISICVGILSTSAALLATFVWPILQRLI